VHGGYQARQGWCRSKVGNNRSSRGGSGGGGEGGGGYQARQGWCRGNAIEVVAEKDGGVEGMTVVERVEGGGGVERGSRGGAGAT